MFAERVNRALNYVVRFGRPAHRELYFHYPNYGAKKAQKINNSGGSNVISLLLNTLPVTRAC